MLKNRTPGGEKLITVQSRIVLDDLTETRENVQEFNIHQARRPRTRFLGDIYVL